MPRPGPTACCCRISFCASWNGCSAPSKPEIARTLRRLLETEVFAFLDRGAVTAALRDYEGGGGDFSDYLIGATAARAGAATTYTFDRALRRAGGFDLPG